MTGSPVLARRAGGCKGAWSDQTRRVERGGMRHLLRSGMVAALGLGAVMSVSLTEAASSAAVAGPPSLTLSIRKVDRDVVGERTPGMAGIKYGAEGGEVLGDDQGTLHWFTSEQYADPYWVVNRIAHWTSKDGLTWHRDPRWVKEGNHDQTGTLDKSDYFDPTLVYDRKTGYWYMFYVGYRYSKAKTWYVAKIYRAKSMVPGRAGLGGPYHDNDADDVVVLAPVAHPAPYEAKWVGDTKRGYGAASVTIYRAGDIWYMLWAENMLATASAPSGTFTRLPEGPNNPVTFGRPPMDWITNYIATPIQEHFYFENPIVIRIPSHRVGAGTYLMVAGNYTDASLGVTRATCGYATSPDGLHWSEVRPLNPGFGGCTTALSLLPEADGSYTMFITDRDFVEQKAGELQSSGTIVVPSFESMSRVEVSVARP